MTWNALGCFRTAPDVIGGVGIRAISLMNKIVSFIGGPLIIKDTKLY